MTFRAPSPRCASCGALLEPLMLFEIAVERCARCGSAWLEGLAATPGPLHDPQCGCPRCSAPLHDALELRGALACTAACGLFVPRERFAALLHPAAAGTRPPPSTEAARVLAILRALSREATREEAP